MTKPRKPFVPVVVGTRDPLEEWRKSEPRELLLTIQKDGEPDYEITIPASSNSAVSLAYLREARRSDHGVATAWLLETVLGTEDFNRLVDEADLDDDTMSAITAHVIRRATGGLESPKGS